MIRSRPDRFDRTWESKSRYAMDWFYPVRCGVVTGDPAAREILEWLFQRTDEGIFWTGYQVERLDRSERSGSPERIRIEDNGG